MIATDTIAKAYSSLRAALALRRIVLHRSEQRHGSVLYVAQPANYPHWSRSIGSLAEVGAFARLVGAVA